MSFGCDLAPSLCEDEEEEEEEDITSAESESSEEEEGGPGDGQNATRQLEWDDSTLSY